MPLISQIPTSHRRILIFNLVFFVVGIVVMLIEVFQVSPEQRQYYVISKIVFFALFASGTILVLINKKWIRQGAYHLIFFSYIYYSVAGEAFRPTYEYSLLLTSLAMALVMPFRAIVMYFYIFLNLVAFCCVYYVFYERNIMLAKEMNVFDNMFSFFGFSLLAVSVYYVLSSEKKQREKAIQRYTLMGAQATTIIHDLKNVLATPNLLVDHLRQAVAENNQPEIDESLKNIERKLQHASQSLLRVNQMSMLSNTKKLTVNLSNLIDEVKLILGRRLKDVHVELNGDKALNVDYGFTSSLFLNLFINSLAALHGKDNKKIKIDITENKITFSDNGGGFQLDVLKDIQRNNSVTTKLDGSGYGLVIVKEACQELGAEVNFSNNSHGAQIQIIF